jgi:hypothetical protein
VRARLLASGIAILLAAIASALLATVAFSGGATHAKHLAPVAAAAATQGKIHEDQDVAVDGETYGVSTYDSAPSRTCVVNWTSTEPSDDGPSMSCFDPHTAFGDGRDVLVFINARQKSGSEPQLTWNKVWISGVAGPRVAQLELRRLDCSVAPVRLSENKTFLYVARPSDIADGTLPDRLFARASDESVIFTRNVRVGLPSNAREAGLTAPRAAAACR